MDIKIIEGGIQQLESIVALFNKYMLFYKQPSDESKYKTYLKDRIENGDATISLAVENENNVIGFVLNYHSFSSVSLGKTIVLNDLFVDWNYRKKGVGEKLIRKTFTLAKEKGAVRVDLGTAKDNYDAQKLYEKTGFSRDEEFYLYSYNL